MLARYRHMRGQCPRSAAGAIRAIAATLGVALALSACSSPPPAAPDPAALTPLDAGASPDCGLPRFEATATATLNAYRTVGARCGSPGVHRTAAPLAWQPAWLPVGAASVRERAAGGASDPKATDRIWRARMNRPDADRLRINRAQGPRTVEAALADWVSRDADCARLMQPEPTEFVLACADSGTGQRHWLLLLAPPR